mmetsp:Transcript_110569/g.219865  ORF Transcript_110569/g.219865 Transcript_110569/m.219865 type:complete len:218 (-) Transcript_110569:651-1304(-)
MLGQVAIQPIATIARHQRAVQPSIGRDRRATTSCSHHSVDNACDISLVRPYRKVKHIVTKRVHNSVCYCQESLVDEDNDCCGEHLLNHNERVTFGNCFGKLASRLDGHEDILHIHQQCDEVHISKRELCIQIHVDVGHAIPCSQALSYHRLTTWCRGLVVIHSIADNVHDPRPNDHGSLPQQLVLLHEFGLCVRQQVKLQQAVYILIFARSLNQQLN